jgi:hypothetical protein
MLSWDILVWQYQFFQKDLEHLQLLYESFRVVAEVELLYYSTLTCCRTSTEKNLALGRLKQGLVVCNHLLGKEKHFLFHTN